MEVELADTAVERNMRRIMFSDDVFKLFSISSSRTLALQVM
jgi:hypothetical protein